MKEERKTNYEAPQIVVLEVAIEKGFATSSGLDVGIEGWGDPGEDLGGTVE